MAYFKVLTSLADTELKQEVEMGGARVCDPRAVWWQDMLRKDKVSLLLKRG